MRLLLGVAVLLLVTGSLAGCFERRGTLGIFLEVSDGGALREFRQVNLSLFRVQIDARTLNPQPFESEVGRVELVAQANQGPVQIFRQEVRSDRYQQIALTTPPGATFDGQLLDGTVVAVVVPNNVLVTQPDFEVPRGGETNYYFVVEVQKNQPGQGSPVYTIVPDREASGVR